MTLVAGFRCTDGFVVAADTELTHGSILFQGHKLAVYDGKASAYILRIGYAGDVSLGTMASQKIRDAVDGLAKPTLAEIRAKTEEVIKQVYDEHVFRDWASISQQLVPDPVELVIGVEDAGREFGILRTERNAVFEVPGYTFAGSGAQLAGHLAERIFGADPLPTAVTELLVQQFFREIKGKAIYVGGNTEIISRRSNPDGERFFDIASRVAIDDNPNWPKGLAQRLADRLDLRFLWGLDDALLSAVRIALNPKPPTGWPPHHVAVVFEERLEFIRRRLEELREDSQKGRKDTSNERRLTDYGTSYHPNKDLANLGSGPFKEDESFFFEKR